MDRRTFLAASAGLLASPVLAQKKETIKIVSSLPRTGSAQGQVLASVGSKERLFARSSRRRAVAARSVSP